MLIQISCDKENGLGSFKNIIKTVSNTNGMKIMDLDIGCLFIEIKIENEKSIFDILKQCKTKIEIGIFEQEETLWL